MLWFLPFFLFWFLGVSDLYAQKAEPEQENEVAALPREPTSAEMMQREIDRRREETFRLNEILDLADRLYRSGECVKWNKASGRVLPGLTRRRVAEAAMMR